jgi:hypothetical protein
VTTLAGGALEAGDEVGPVGRLTHRAGGDDGDALGAGGARSGDVLDDRRRRSRCRRLAETTGGGQAFAQAGDSLIAVDDLPRRSAGTHVGDQQVDGIAADIDGGQAHGVLTIRTNAPPVCVPAGRQIDRDGVAATSSAASGCR